MTTAKEVAYRNEPQDARVRGFTRASLSPRADHSAQLFAFHVLYDVPHRALNNDDPEFKHMDDARVALRAELIAEEVKEMLSDGLGVEPIDFLYPGDNDQAAMVRDGKRDGALLADALGDIVYLCYGFALELGYDLQAVLAEIHAANLTKLGADGKPIYREDGKVLKGPNYHAPNVPAALGWIGA